MLSDLIKYAVVGAAVILVPAAVRVAYRALPRFVKDSEAESALDEQIASDYRAVEAQLKPEDRARLKPSRYWASRRAPAAV